MGDIWIDWRLQGESLGHWTEQPRCDENIIVSVTVSRYPERFVAQLHRNAELAHQSGTPMPLRSEAGLRRSLEAFIGVAFVMTLRSRILQWLDPPPPVLLEAPPPSRLPSKRHEAPKIRLSAESARRIITIKVGDENSAGTPCEFTLAVRTARAMAKDVLRICRQPWTGAWSPRVEHVAGAVG